MRKYKTAAALLIIVLMIAYTFFVDSSNEAKLIILIAGLVVLAVLNRGNAVYAKATKILTRKNPAELESAVRLMEKALDLGCSENNTVIAATLVLQHGNIEKAKKSLEEVKDSSSKNIRARAKTSLSMYYWLKGDLDTAIRLAEEAKEDNKKSANLYANLCTYYLAKNDRKSYKKTLAEAFHYNATSIALIDIQAIYFIISSDYKKAGVTLEKLFSQTKPGYSAPYIHYAMVYLKYGHVRDAINMLKDSLSTSFSNTSLLSEEEIESMIEGLENPDTRLKWVDAINNDRMLALKAELPRLRKIAYERSESDIIPGYPELPDFRDDSFMAKEDELEDEREDVDTSLNAEDEAWLEKHQD